MIKRLNDYLKPYNLTLDDGQLDKFVEYNRLLIEYNNKVNLTTITEPLEVIIKHFFHSLTPAVYFDFADKKVVDLGAGAGFPGIPLKILFPDIKLTLIDSLQKRIRFLTEVTERLELADVNVVHGRAEELAHLAEYREQYDIVIARAVARLNVLVELALPFVKIGGNFIAMKASKAEAELSEAAPAMKKLGGRASETYTLDLPEESGERSLLLINKVAMTPKVFPRKPGEPARRPLV